MKKLFIGFACFVVFSLLIAWQFAAAELAALEKERDSSVKNQHSELASAQSQPQLFI